jgi:Zn-dependent M16 (insulinase) family peptidase
LNAINFGNATNHLANTSFIQEPFLNDIAAKLDSEPELVIKELEQLRNELTQSQNLHVHVIADVYKQEQPMRPWVNSFLPLASTSSNASVTELVHARQFLSDRATSVDTPKCGHAFGIKSTESGYLFQSCIGLTGFKDPDHAALAVAIEYLTSFEGPFWISIRGKGLSYNFNMTVRYCFLVVLLLTVK